MAAKPDSGLLDAVMAFVTASFDAPGAHDVAGRLVDRAAELSGAAFSGLVFVSDAGTIEPLAATDPAAGALDAHQLRIGAGPVVESVRRGAVVTTDVRETAAAETTFRDAALALGVRGASTVPMRRGTTTVGALTVYRTLPGGMPDGTVRDLQTLADVATQAISQRREHVRAVTVRDQLQWALDHRVVVEQAKGATAIRRGVTVDEAFELMRGYARRTSTPLVDVARLVLAAELDL